MPTLDELIGEQKRRRGFSYADLEARADSVIRRQRWQQLGTGVRIKEFPEPATIEAMAKALDVDVAVVVLAAARSIGLDVKRGAQSDLAAMLPYSAYRLTPDQRAAIVSLVRSITEEPADAQSSTSTTPSRTSSEADEDEKTGEIDVIRDSLAGLYRMLYASANEDATRNVLVAQAENRLAEGSGLDIRITIEPEVPDHVYVQFLVARLSGGPQGDAELFDALDLPRDQFESANDRYHRERSEMILWGGHLRTRGVEPLFGSPAKIVPLSLARDDNDQRTAARRGPGRTKGEQLRGDLDRDAEAPDPEGPEQGA